MIELYKNEVIDLLGGNSGPNDDGTDEAFRFLVVDDASSVRDMIAQLLREHRQEIVEAEDGVDAMKAYQKSVVDGTPFDCLFMDFVMPHMDGSTATK